jgi:ADP-ribosylglycohydrolase
LTTLDAKAAGCLAGAAVGDGLGSATEGWTPDQIREQHGGWVTGVVAPAGNAGKPPPRVSRYKKGEGRVTDDTLMTRALVSVYERLRRHLTAYDVADTLVPILVDETHWIPDMEREDQLLQRLFLAEKWLVTRLQHGHVDPREAGTGNIVNCGTAMYIAPVGIANAGNPDGAYAEALDIAGAHQSSYGREAAGVMAAAVAAAMTVGATVDRVVETALRLAKDGTRTAIECVCTRAAELSDWPAAIPVLRAAVEPFDSVGPDYRNPGLGARRPSRLHAIEELPVALGFLVVASGAYRSAVLGGVNYGRDSDSIASIAGALAGALGGIESIPSEWRDKVAAASRMDLEAPGSAMAEVAREIFAADRMRWEAHAAAFEKTAGGDGGCG